MDLSKFTYLESYPPDGLYLCRLDDEDEEPVRITVKDGVAFNQDGKRQIIYGFEWKAV